MRGGRDVGWFLGGGGVDAFRLGLVKAVVLAWVLLAAACTPGRNAHVQKARELAAAACCSPSDVQGAVCPRCALLEGATIVGEKVEDSCANSCELVELQTHGPNGDGVCTYQVSWWNDAWHVTGGCHPR